ncbi:hypothetical protein DPMN_102911 [Dreissena polymorpha]|uniref:Uncharacterized protein n=1 Tax=Dreissena polymorpha TaxID=45954 RepID=A0A9D4K2G3_DREPO|nr:hypothetical protein DPMN_102911 [Dreissena polymorpha]
MPSYLSVGLEPHHAVVRYCAVRRDTEERQHGTRATKHAGTAFGHLDPFPSNCQFTCSSQSSESVHPTVPWFMYCTLTGYVSYRKD